MSYPYEMAVFASRNRERAYETVIKAIELAAAKTGINRKQIAAATGRKPSQVSATLSGPSNWTLDTVSDLLRAVGATMEYEVVFDDDRAKANEFHPAARPSKRPLPVVQVVRSLPITGTNAAALEAHAEAV